MIAFIQETLPALENIFLGPVHPLSWNSVQITPANEEGWKNLAKRCKLYPSGEEFDDLYWQTLIGDRIREPSGTTIKPFQEWRDAYRVWCELISRNEGILPRLRKGKTTKIREQLHPLVLDFLHIERPTPEKTPEPLLLYFTDLEKRIAKAREKDTPFLVALSRRIEAIESGYIDFKSTFNKVAATMAPKSLAKLSIKDTDKRIE